MSQGKDDIRLELSSKFNALTNDLLGKSTIRDMHTSNLARNSESRGMHFEVSQRTKNTFLKGFGESPYYPPEAVIDLADITADIAISSNRSVLANESAKLKEMATEAVSEEELVSRYGDYQDAMLGMASAAEILKSLSSKVDADLEKTEDKSWFNLVKETIHQVGVMVGKAFNRILLGLEAAYSNLKDFGKAMQDLISSIASKAKKEITLGFQKVVQNLGTLFGRIISCMFGWFAAVRTIAHKRGFRLSEITVKLASIEVEKMPLFGLIIPVPKITMPEVNMKFT